MSGQGPHAGVALLNEGAARDAPPPAAACLDVIHLAQLAALDNLLDFPHAAVVPGLEADGEDFARLLLHPAHGLGVL